MRHEWLVVPPVSCDHRMPSGSAPVEKNCARKEKGKEQMTDSARLRMNHLLTGESMKHQTSAPPCTGPSEPLSLMVARRIRL